MTIQTLMLSMILTRELGVPMIYGVPVIYGMMLAFLMNLNECIFAHFLGFEAPDRWDPGNPIYGEPVWNTLFGMEIFSFTSALGMM